MTEPEPEHVPATEQEMREDIEGLVRLVNQLLRRSGYHDRLELLEKDPMLRTLTQAESRKKPQGKTDGDVQ